MTTNKTKPTDFQLPPQPWNLEAAKNIIDELERSGFTVARFARTHDVTPYKIRRCQRLVDEWMLGPKKSDNPLLSVRIKEPAPTQEAFSTAIFEVKTRGGLLLKFPQDICPETLARILRNLMEASC